MLTIKRYQNTRKYYDTEKCHYIAFPDFVQMVRDGVEFQVIDNRSGVDVTAETLFNVIVESSRATANAIPVERLRAIISDGTLREFVRRAG
jgi:polyhydroxyalkanoate synthesis repressor PhaR